MRNKCGIFTHRGTLIFLVLRCSETEIHARQIFFSRLSFLVVHLVKLFQFTVQLKEKSYQNISSASSDDSSKETTKEVSDEETHTLEPRESTDPIQENIPASVEPQHVVEEIPEENSNMISSETHVEGEDDWQPVQRPRSAGSYGRRVKQRRAAIGKVYSYQKKYVDTDMEYPSVKNTNQNSRYYLLKKRPTSHGSYTENHIANPSQGTKFGRRIVKAVAYRVKSMPLSTKVIAAESLSSSEVSPNVSPHGIGPVKSSIVSLGKSPSYKEVALAPPGSINKMQTAFPQNGTPDNHEDGIQIREEEKIEVKGESKPKITVVEPILEEKKDSVLATAEALREQTGLVEKKDGIDSTEAKEDNTSLIFGTMDELGSSAVKIQEAVVDNLLIDGLPKSIDSAKEGLCENNPSGTCELHESNSTLQGVDDLEASSGASSVDTRGLPNKKLSASAAPFNPSPSIRAAPVPMNIAIPSGAGSVPTIAPWPVNMNIHPGAATVLPTANPMCSSPHHAYPSPPATPNIIQPLPFMFPPPYSQPHVVRTSTFPVTSAFNPNHFTWQCNVNPNVSEFVPTTVWHGCHPMEFSAPAPVVEPISDPPPLETKLQSDDSVPVLPVDIDNVGETKKEADILTSEAISNPIESVQDDGPSLWGVENAQNEPCDSPNGKVGSSTERTTDGEKTFSILIRGRRNRKQTLRMPVSLLSRPYGSQSFKVIYNRVVRGNEASKSINFSSSENCTATAT